MARDGFTDTLTPRSLAWIDRTSNAGTYSIMAVQRHPQDVPEVQVYARGRRMPVLTFTASLLIRQQFALDGDRSLWDRLPEYVKAEACAISDRARAMFRKGHESLQRAS